MVIFHAAALVCGFGAAFLLVYALTPGPAQVYELRQRAAARAEARAIPSPILRILWPLLSALVPITRRLGSPKYRERQAGNMPRADFPKVMTVDHLIGMKLVLSAAGLLLLYAATHSLLAGILGGLGGYFMPDRMVKERKAAREQKVVRALPGAVDMMTLAVEAGLDFVAALQRVVDKAGAGPLREEFAVVLGDIRLGASRASALRSFAQRVSVPEVASFAGVLVQADRLGASIGDVLRSQADRMRTERFQRAEKAGAAASQKLLLPLAVFIFPAVLIVIIGPAALSFIYGGGF